MKKPEQPKASWRLPPQLGAWTEEPEPVDESTFTKWAAPGWRAWNSASPELEVCEFARSLVRLIRPALVIETGVGQGYATRRMAKSLALDSSLLAFESDSEWRAALAALPFWDGKRLILATEPTPAAEQWAACGLAVIDSDVDLRMEEIQTWATQAPDGSYCLIHDAGNGHSAQRPGLGHASLQALIQSLSLTGAWLPNPRGAFLARKGGAWP